MQDSPAIKQYEDGHTMEHQPGVGGKGAEIISKTDSANKRYANYEWPRFGSEECCIQQYSNPIDDTAGT